MKKLFIISCIFSFALIDGMTKEKLPTKPAIEILLAADYHSADTVKAPKLLEMRAPVYPEKAKEMKIEGIVYLQILVDTEGKASVVKIFKSDNDVFNQAAVDAAKLARFEPAQSKRERVKDWIIIPVSFELKTENEKLFDSALEEMGKKQYETAITYLNKIISGEPKKGELYRLRAQCYEQLNNNEVARLDYKRAIALEKKDLKKKSKYEDELDKLLKSWYPGLRKKIDLLLGMIATDSNNVRNYLEVGKLYHTLEEWDQAEKWYDKYLIRNDNASQDEIIRYTDLLAKTGRIIKGKQILKKFVERYPNDWRLWSRYGYFTLWLAEYEISKNAFESALKLKPSFKEAQDGLDIVNKRPLETK